MKINNTKIPCEIAHPEQFAQVVDRSYQKSILPWCSVGKKIYDMIHSPPLIYLCGYYFERVVIFKSLIKILFTLFLKNN